MAYQTARLSRDEVLTLMERLAQESLSFRVDLWAYGTHEGDSFSREWRGPIAYELHVGGSAPPTVLDSGYMARVGAIAHEYGLEAYLSSGDGTHQINLVPKKDSEYDWTRVFASDLQNGVGHIDPPPPPDPPKPPFGQWRHKETGETIEVVQEGDLLPYRTEDGQGFLSREYLQENYDRQGGET